MEKAIDIIKGEENLINMEHWTIILEKGKGKKKHCRKYGLGRRNYRGDRLIEYCVIHDLIIMNAYFYCHSRRRYTWKMRGDVGSYKIYIIMVKNRFKNQVKDNRSNPSADIDNDHNLLMLKYNLKLKKY